MIDKIVNAINEVLGGSEEPSTPEQPKREAGKGFVPADGASEQQQTGAKERNLDQLVADAKNQLGDKPQ